MRRRIRARRTTTPARGLVLASCFVCSGWFACTLYDQDLIDGARGGAGPSATSGAGGSTPNASGGSDENPTGGTDGSAATGGTGGEADGSGGSSFPGSAGRAGNGGSSGSASSTGGVAGAGGEPNDAGQAGTNEAGAGGDAGCDAPPGCDCATIDSCNELHDALVHRYGFDGTGSSVPDGAGSLDGEVVAAELAGDGTLALPGGLALEGETLGHVEFPSDCLSGLVNATFEMWFSWDATGPSWTRVFDFGETSTTTAGTSFWFSPLAGTGVAASSRAGFSGEVPGTGYMNQILVLGPALETGTHHAVVVADDSANMLSLYVDGSFAGTQALPRPLANVNATNCWLGRSNDATDPYFAGGLDEFRIYDAALSAAAIELSYASGPDPDFLADSAADPADAPSPRVLRNAP